MDLVGADADFGAQAELAAVVEAGAGVDHHGGAVDLGDEPLGGGEVGRDDRLGVAGAVAGDVGDGIVEGVDNGDRQDLVEILRVPVGRLGGLHVWDELPGGRVAAKLDPSLKSASAAMGRKYGGDRAMDQERLGRVADARALDLRVDDDLDRHVEVAAGIDVDVAVSLVVLEDGHRRLGDDAADQAFAAPGDGQIDEIGEAQELADGRAVDRRDELDGVLGEAGGGELVGEDAMEGAVGGEGLLAAAEDTALPLLTQSAAASTVTFGRLS